MLALLLVVLGAAPADSASAVDPLDSVDLSGHVVILSADDGLRSTYERVYPLLKRHGMTLTLALIGDYVEGRDGTYGRAAGYMTREQIQEMIDSCSIEVASHSMSHARLTRLDSSDAWREIHDSKVLLESLFGRPVITFVYPYGDMNARVRDLVRRAGYRLARAVRPGNPNFWTDPYRIPEVELRKERTLADLKRHVARRPLTVVMMHRIVDAPKAFTEWPADSLAALLDWLDRRQVRVTTMADHYHYWWRQRLEAVLREQAWFDPVFAPGGLFEDVEVDAAGTAHSP
jgi:peptidoglycan/xylan/chitin deacetylase (PgdA/CDA1 family)